MWTQLNEARELLEKFERKMCTLDGRLELEKALTLLDDVRASPESAVAEMAVNLANTYLTKVQQAVESYVSEEPALHIDNVLYFDQLFKTFEQFDFALPEEVAKTRGNLWFKKAVAELNLMSPAERKALLAKIQAGSADIQASARPRL